MMFLYGINLVPLTEDLRDADPTILSPFYADDVVFDGSARRSAVKLRLLMDRGIDQGYLLKASKSLFITDKPEEEEVARQ